jgi:spore coat polysaccharide biosynthesis protein SpsF
MRTVATIEARFNSSRLPGKVLVDLGGKPALQVMVERLKYVAQLDEIVIATTTNESDDAVAGLAKRLGVGIWRGSEDDVMGRVLDAAKAHGADVIVELTGDCPLIDPIIVSRVIQYYQGAKIDYVSNVLTRTFPIGMDVQVFATKVLADAEKRTNDPDDRENVSLYIYRHPDLYSLDNVRAWGAEARPDLRLTLDEEEDLFVLRSIHQALQSGGMDYSLREIISYLDAHPVIQAHNAHVQHRWV